MSELLQGFAISGYRSIGDELVKIAPLKKINLIIGQNNSGKSNIINFLYHHYADFFELIKGTKRGLDNALSDLDKHKPTRVSKYRFGLPLTLGKELEEKLDSLLDKSSETTKTNTKAAFNDALSRSTMFENGFVWFIFESEDGNSGYSLNIDVNMLSGLLNRNTWQQTWNQMTGSTGGGLETHWIPEVMDKLAKPTGEPPRIQLIPSIRRIGEAGSQADDFGGSGIIDRLARLQNPSVSQQHQRNKFDSINKFLQEVLERPDAVLEVPFERDVIQVHMDNKVLPLASLGTGVHEVIILAAAATILNRTVLCIEEPELHIHPLLQRKLIHYLCNNTDNQYIFTTHSAHLLDAVPSEVFHVRHSGENTTVEQVASTKEKSGVCAELGYRASDLLQTNCVIWVEGPSDRIYLNYWISSQTDQLLEGIHYSIMFYGGKLFSHVSGYDKDEYDQSVNDFISLRSLNRHSVIIFDSDLRSARNKLSKTKERLKSEFNAGPGFAWVTKGREIENYLDEEKLKVCIRNVHSNAKVFPETGVWGNLLHYSKRRNGKILCANKVKVARKYTSMYPVNLDILDLGERVDQLIRFVVDVNGLESQHSE